MDNKYVCYMHISPSNKKYIGITCQETDRRWQKGKGYKNNQYFSRSIDKYGWDNFQHIIIARGLSEEEAKWLEIELIRELDTTNIDYGYNITHGGEGNNGNHHSEETKKKISKAHKGKFCGKNNPMYGKDWREGKTEYELREISEKKSKALKGRTFTEESIKKMSDARKGMKFSEEHRKNLSKAAKGRKHSEESIKKMSDARKGLFAGEKSPCAKKVTCITTGKVFNTLKQAAEYYNINNDISECCRGKRKSCGKLPDGTPLKWKYYEKGDDTVD